MKVNRKVLCLFSLTVLFAIPHLPYYSYGLARIIDIVSLGILTFIMLLLNKKESIKLNQLSLLFLSLCIINVIFILMGNIYGAKGEYSSIQDISDIYRPLWWIVSYLVGIGFAVNMVHRQEFYKFIITISSMSLFVAFLEKIGVAFLYKLYSGGLHIVSNRATGIAQDFGDYSFIQAIGSTISLMYYLEFKRKRYLMISVCLMISILLSTSKAGLALLISSGSLLVISIVFRKETKFIYKLVFIFFIMVIINLSIQYITSNEKFLLEIKSLINGDINLPSIRNRLDDFFYVKQVIFDNPGLATMFGVGANKGLTDAYIEVALLSNLYRVGVLGTIFYYTVFISVFIIFFRKKFFVLAFLVLAAVVIDLFAAMTNRLISVSMLMMLFGYLSYESSSYNDRNMV